MTELDQAHYAKLEAPNHSIDRSSELRKILRQLVINCDEDPLFMSDENYFIQAEQAIEALYTSPEQSSDELVGVTVKPVLAMFIAGLRHDDITFKEKALEIAKELEMNNQMELAHYIYAQYGLVRTFEVTD